MAMNEVAMRMRNYRVNILPATLHRSICETFKLNRARFIKVKDRRWDVMQQKSPPNRR